MKVKYKSQLTQSYAAGCLVAKLYNTYYTRNDLPSVILCMRNFQSLKTLFGKYYNLMKSNQYCNPYIIHYEQFNRLDLDKSLIGELTDFFLGYADTIKRDKI